jgi:hypothetical protein
VQAEVEQSVRAVGWRDVLGAVVVGD